MSEHGEMKFHRLWHSSAVFVIYLRIIIDYSRLPNEHNHSSKKIVAAPIERPTDMPMGSATVHKIIP